MNREDRQIDKEYPRRDREFMQQIVDMWIPGLKLPDPRTEEEFKLAVESPVSDITGEELEIKYKDAVPNSIVSRYREESAYMKAFPKFVTVSEQTRLNVLKMILTEEEYEQVVELYEKEKTLKKHRGVGGDE